MNKPSTHAPFHAVPNYHETYTSLLKALKAVIAFYQKRPSEVFVLASNHTGKRFRVMPNLHFINYRAATQMPTYSIMFKGSYYQLTQITMHLPLDLFGTNDVT